VAHARFKDLVGKSVAGSNGRIMGILADFGVDTETWRVASLQLKVDSKAVTDLGLSKPLWRSARVEVPSELIRAAKDIVILKVSLEEFAERLKSAVPEAEHESEPSKGASPA
jgi:sporulation protein YlmC with PRC-barrel domain